MRTILISLALAALIGLAFVAGMAVLDHFAGARTLICHRTGKGQGRTMSVARAAVQTHLAHGDDLGPCPSWYGND